MSEMAIGQGRPGIYVREAPLPRTVTPQNTSASLGVILGAAAQGPAGATYFRSWREFVSAFNDVQIVSPLARAVYQAFAGGSGPLYVVRVTGSASQAATVDPDDLEAIPFEVSAKSPGTWGNNVTVTFTPDFDGEDFAGTWSVAVSYTNANQVSSSEYTFSNLSLDSTDSRYYKQIINDQVSGSMWIEAGDPTEADLSDPVDTSVVVQLLGGSYTEPSAADYADALSALDEVESNLLLYCADAGYMPTGDAASVATALATYAAGRNGGDSFAVLDAPGGLLPPNTEGAPSGPTEITGFTGAAGSTYAALYYPHIRIPNPSTSSPPGSTLLVPPGASVLGMILTNDRTKGPWAAPAGTSVALPNTVGGPVGVERTLAAEELDLLNSAASPVNAIRPMTNAGISVMGARTRNSTTLGKYISVRRSLNYFKKELANRSRFALFEPITTSLMRTLEVSLSAFLLDAWTQGALAGGDPNAGFYVVCDTTNNTAQSAAQGILNIEVGLALLIPAEFIVLQIGYFEGGATVQELG